MPEVLPPVRRTSAAQGDEVIVALTAFAQRSVNFAQEVRGEVKKITWPTWDDLRRSTLIITVLIIIIGIVIGLMDWLFSRLLIDLLGRVFA
jgi:preprotein translocase subunit SecE